MPQSRQLAAIMFTDIVGYTALMGDDEQKAFEILKQNRLLQKPLIEQYGGHCIKELGDGLLACFTTVSDAVNAAIKIQEACNVSKDFLLRIGIHQGEVVFEQDDIFGDAVNIASRIQALAPIGRIWVSESVHNNVSNKREIKTKFVRAETLKNVKERIRIYEVITNNDASDQSDLVSDKPTKKLPEKSIAVLPFADMSPLRDQEYLGDGLAEELINLLSQISELKVIGRTSSFSFKKKEVDLKTIGKTLNDKTILEGSIQKSGNRIRITAQLINADDDYHIWSQRYDREMNDIFALQDDICSKIAEHLKLTLLKGDETVVEKPTDNIEAYELYLKGEFNYKKYTAEGFEKAIEYLTKAVELDPDYADAWWSLGVAYWDTQAWLLVQDRSVIEKVRYCAKKAIEADEFNRNGHFLLALIYMNADWDWEKAGAEIALGNKYQKQQIAFLPLEPFYRAMLYGDFDFAIHQLEK